MSGAPVWNATELGVQHLKHHLVCQEVEPRADHDHLRSACRVKASSVATASSAGGDSILGHVYLPPMPRQPRSRRASITGESTTALRHCRAGRRQDEVARAAGSVATSSMTVWMNRILSSTGVGSTNG